MQDEDIIRSIRVHLDEVTGCGGCKYTEGIPAATCFLNMIEDAANALETSEKNRMYLFDRVCELEEDNSELKELVPKWISAKDELPPPIHPSDPDYRPYLIIADGYMYVADYSYDKYFETCYSFHVDGEAMTGVTHWCKIPEPPKGE